MFNYIINWDKIIKENLPVFFHKLFRLAWITALIKPFKIMHAEFLQLRDDYMYKVRYNSQVIYLERILNDKFDPTNRAIYITDLSQVNEEYLYQKIESKPANYLYSKWKIGNPYLIGEYAVDENNVYVALTNNAGLQPSLNPGDWAFYKINKFLYLKSEHNSSGGFIVNVPIALIYNDSMMRAIINYYRFASKQYVINLY
ncbi:MAG: hypothetical protein K8R85_11135 [Bacteroidetes bacterium]|nr:hypothetical protein [Bacteroidota bacterium]